MGGVYGALGKLIDRLPPWLAIIVVIVPAMLEFRHEIAGLFKSATRRNELLLANIRNRVELIDLAKRAGIAVPVSSLANLEQDISVMLQIREVQLEELPAPRNNPWYKRYLVAAMGGFLFSFVALIIFIPGQFEFGPAIMVALFFAAIGVPSAAFFTSQRSGYYFTAFAGAFGTIAFIAVVVLLNALGK
jgi:hypothetical protein